MNYNLDILISAHTHTESRHSKQTAEGVLGDGAQTSAVGVVGGVGVVGVVVAVCRWCCEGGVEVG